MASSSWSSGTTITSPGVVQLNMRFFQAIAASPAMFRRRPGAGSLYWLGLRDKTGAYLDGANAYRLSIPVPVPARRSRSGRLTAIPAYAASPRTFAFWEANSSSVRMPWSRSPASSFKRSTGSA